MRPGVCFAGGRALRRGPAMGVFGRETIMALSELQGLFFCGQYYYLIISCGVLCCSDMVMLYGIPAHVDCLDLLI